MQSDVRMQSTTAVDHYLALDLSSDGAIAQALLQQAPHEGAERLLVLSARGDKGASSAGLTPAMNGWIGSYISPVRASALAELEKQAQDIKIAPNVGGTVLEIERDRHERHHAERTTDVLDAFNAKHKPLLEEVGMLQSEYDAMRADEGRDAKVPNKLVEFGLMLPLVMAPEALLNFESFRRAPIIQSDAMALGATILVGFGIAAASYCIGLFIRQVNYFLQPDNDSRLRSGWPLYTWGSSALLVSLGSVAVARYYYLLPRIQEAIVLGQPVPNIPVSIGSLLFGNLICFLVGAIITFFLNDPNPLFADRCERLEKAKRKLTRISRREVDVKLDQINARLKLDREGAARRANQMAVKPGYGQLRERFALLSAKDNEVLGVLKAYRMSLVRAARERGNAPEFRLRDPTADRSNPDIVMDAEHFEAYPLALSRSA